VQVVPHRRARGGAIQGPRRAAGRASRKGRHR
jgi:hypothetical protein